MKRIICILGFLLAFESNAQMTCDQQRDNFPNLNWEKLTDLTVITIIQNLEASLCLGRNGEVIELISYEDSSGNKDTFEIGELLKGPLVLLTDEDINVGGIIKKGKIMTLLMNEITLNKHYKLSLNFLRNLAVVPTNRDFRRLTVDVYENYRGKLRGYYREKENSFDHVEINVSALLNINEATIFEYGSVVKTLKTKNLPIIDEL